jgi:hypothetical protein
VAAELLFRCHTLGKLMASPTAAAVKAGELLSVGAKTYIRQLAAQEIFSVEFQIDSKEIQKGLRCEDEAIGLLNRVRGLSLTKNAERRSDGIITGECDLFNPMACDGRDLKCSWSIKTFPLLVVDCADAEYEWQMRGYMRLWDAPRWHVDYALLDTPEDLIGYEQPALHIVSHIPEHLRLTTWTVERDAKKEERMVEKVSAARAYLAQVIREFDVSHRQGMPMPNLIETVAA